jgi:hypothetical protein
MRLIRCTKKVLLEVGLPMNELCESDITQLPLGDWYVNIIKVYRKKGIMFVNEITLFSFPVFGIPKSKMQNLAEIFRTTFSEELEREGFEDSTIGKVLQLYKDVGIGRCTNKSMLGNMNYLAFRYKNMPINYEDFDPHDVYEATGNINRTPQKTLGWEYSIDKLKKALCD